MRGLTAACFGMMLAMIGTDPQSGTLRWTLDTLYLWDGMPLVTFTLGIFALPELCDLAISRLAVVGQGQTVDTKTGMLLGVKTVDSHPQEVLDLVAAATGDLFQGNNVATIEKLFRQSRGVKEDGIVQMSVLNPNRLLFEPITG